MTVIIGVKLSEKEEHAVKFQKILTDYNCIIKLRLGINTASMLCSNVGIILLQIERNEDALKLEKAIIEVEGIEIQRMIF